MPVVPAVPDFSTGMSSTSQLNQLGDALQFALNPPLCQARQTVAQSIPNSTTTVVTFDTEDVDKSPGGSGGHDNVTNNSRFTAEYAGWYMLSGGWSIAASATGIRSAAWRVNGTVVAGSGVMFTSVSAAASSRIPARTIVVFLNIGDYVELEAFQSSGGPLNTQVLGSEQPNMTVRWVSS